MLDLPNITVDIIERSSGFVRCVSDWFSSAKDQVFRGFLVFWLLVYGQSMLFVWI